MSGIALEKFRRLADALRERRLRQRVDVVACDFHFHGDHRLERPISVFGGVSIVLGPLRVS